MPNLNKPARALVAEVLRSTDPYPTPGTAHRGYSSQDHRAVVNSVTMRQRRGELVDEMRAIHDRAQDENRDLTHAERSDFDALDGAVQTMTERIRAQEAQEQRDAEGAQSLGGAGSRGFAPATRHNPQVALTRDQSLAEHVRARGYGTGLDSLDGAHGIDGTSLRFGETVRGMLTGDWRGADAERRSLLESNAASAGVLVPAPMAAGIIDLARGKARVMQAGALTVPMESSTLKLARQTGDPELAWHTEAAQIDESNLTFDAVTLKAQTLPCLVKFSLEMLEDVDNIDQVVSNAVAAAIGLELDRVALRGSGEAPEPRGIRNSTGVTIIDAGTNGAAATWETLVDAVAAVRTSNYEPGAAILAHRTDKELGTQRENGTSGPYLAPPPYLDGVSRLATSQVPVNLKHGTATDASEIYTGQWNQLLIGVRTTLQVRALNELYAETGELGLLCFVRADVALARGSAFAVVDGVIPAA